ncbi:GMC oxred C domain containing protein [Asbolus verrucosus]|uniref:GMC oxred C domain containing protein n=1 Tax=Asbolus verrucosus TaxID=1661398 RepID=A0A482VJ69_ASBVE|nr:GMC oxred C domain containing protein [Asbolus verrucosus]
MPGCELYEFDSDDYWRCCLRTLGVTLHHQVGTAKMGPPHDPGAVVNHELKVYGIGRLRVADCSVIPFALGAHTNAPATMVGEKAADIIKANWGELKSSL